MSLSIACGPKYSLQNNRLGYPNLSLTSHRNREEAINTQLAILLSRYGITADGETIHLHGKARPDVLFELRGLRVVVEGKLADHPKAGDVVLEDARHRVRSGMAHIAAAAVYPLSLRTTPTAKILEVLETANLRYRIVSETREIEDWFEGTPASLMDALRRAQEGLTEDDIVERTASSLSVQLENVAQLWKGDEGACDRLCSILGIMPPAGETDEKGRARRQTAAKISALVLANALIFQEQLAPTNERVFTLSKLEKQADIISTIRSEWQWIWKNVNYVTIFQLGERVLDELPTSPRTISAIRSLLFEAKAICSQQAALRHDLMGRIYHWLLHHAKYLGTYYTSVSSATLLLKLALAANWKQDLGDPRQLAEFKVADLACGTGTLLMASAQALSDVYIRKRAEDGRNLNPVDLRTLHATLMENTLYGYDVLPSALHLTASTLAMLAPEVAFRAMNLYVMPLGLDHGKPRLGSLDFLTSSEILTQMALDNSHAEVVRTGAAFSHATKATVPKISLCVMNPPFVRSVGGNLLFGSLPDDRGKLQKELKSRVKEIGASLTAGLGSVFVALADRWLTEGGRLAFVLPAALTSGEAWAATRKLISDRYHLETVIASHDAERPNFSENTDLSEVLFIARKLGNKEEAGRTTYVNLWRNPRSIHESLDLANRVTSMKDLVQIEEKSFTSIASPSGKLGEIVTTPCPKGESNWTGALFAQTELLRQYFSLERGRILVPGQREAKYIALCRLDAIGELGYDRRDIHDAFTVSTEDWSPYPAFWNHQADKVFSIAAKPNSYLIPRTKPAEGRKLKDAAAVWSKAGTVLLVERLWPITQRVLAVGFEKEALGSTWWAFKGFCLTADQEKALLIWLNSTAALLLYFGRRVPTRSAWMQMKKPGWNSMPVLDVRTLDEAQLSTFATAYDMLSTETLDALARLNNDSTRRKIDEAICSALSLPDLTPIRELLAREPGLTGQDINPRTKRVT